MERAGGSEGSRERAREREREAEGEMEGRREGGREDGLMERESKSGREGDRERKSDEDREQQAAHTMSSGSLRLSAMAICSLVDRADSACSRIARRDMKIWAAPGAPMVVAAVPVFRSAAASVQRALV